MKNFVNINKPTQPGNKQFNDYIAKFHVKRLVTLNTKQPGIILMFVDGIFTTKCYIINTKNGCN